MKRIQYAIASVALIGNLALIGSGRSEQESPSYYIRVEAGPSFGLCAAIEPNPIIWDSAQEGYDAKLHTAPMVGLEVGVNFCDLWSVGARANYRSKFSYCKKQTPLNSATNGFLGNKTRFFDLDATSFILNLMINRTDNPYCALTICKTTLAPYVGLGIGFARTTLYNFHSVRADMATLGTFITNEVGSIMSPNGMNTFAWDAQVGCNISFCSNISLGIGYRFFDAGRFKTNNYLVDVLAGLTTPIVVYPWCSRLRASELVLQAGIGW
jgi:opacity protein-like surface antigen